MEAGTKKIVEKTVAVVFGIIALLGGLWFAYLKWFRYNNSAIQSCILKYCSPYGSQCPTVTKYLTDRINEMLITDEKRIKDYATANNLSIEQALVTLAWGDCQQEGLIPALPPTNVNAPAPPPAPANS